MPGLGYTVQAGDEDKQVTNLPSNHLSFSPYKIALLYGNTSHCINLFTAQIMWSVRPSIPVTAPNVPLLIFILKNLTHFVIFQACIWGCLWTL
jgi:hypothetical protein